MIYLKKMTIVFQDDLMRVGVLDAPSLSFANAKRHFYLPNKGPPIYLLYNLKYYIKSTCHCNLLLLQPCHRQHAPANP